MQALALVLIATGALTGRIHHVSPAVNYPRLLCLVRDLLLCPPNRNEQRPVNVPHLNSYVRGSLVRRTRILCRDSSRWHNQERNYCDCYNSLVDLHMLLRPHLTRRKQTEKTII